MSYNFDTVIDRYRTDSMKWNATEKLFGEKELLPMWVADMDFRVPEPVIQALKDTAEHGIFGYTMRTDEYYKSITDWMARRHDWDVKPEWISYCSGVVPALSYCIQAFTEPGDKIVIQPPVYPPFTSVVKNNNRQLVYNPLKFEDGGYRMDFDDLRTKLDASVKMLILCNPHNPVGRVWTKEELTELGHICLEHGIRVISDEIHSDLVFKPHKHTPFAGISEELAQNSIVCMAPSKTFNLAGLQASNMIIPNDDWREAFNAKVLLANAGMANTFGLAASTAAYKLGEPWLEELLDYLQQNLNWLAAELEQYLPGINLVRPEGTYLAWLDCRGLGLDKEGLEQWMLKRAKIAFNQGYAFGPGGEGFVRMNYACPRSTLEEGLRRLKNAADHVE